MTRKVPLKTYYDPTGNMAAKERQDQEVAAHYDDQRDEEEAEWLDTARMLRSGSPWQDFE